MIKLVTIVGARPQFIKAAVISRAIERLNSRCSESIAETIIHTGQHFDHNMSGIFFEQLSIPEPHYHLGINSCGHGEMTGRMLGAIERVLLNETPDWVMVYGDTNSTLAGALAARKLHLRLAHVEAGLRSYNMEMPEEQNRLVADRLANLLFCPTLAAVSNLAAEGIGTSPYGEKVLQVGDVMYDAALFYASRAEAVSRILGQLGVASGGYALATLHRAENTDHPGRLQEIFGALNQIARKLPVIMPLHPRTRKIAAELGIDMQALTVIDPVSYLDMIVLEKQCKLVLTDSGGVQKESYFFKKPCLTLRDETEWIELVQGGVNIVTGAKKSAILSGFNSIESSSLDFSTQYYGTGNAGERIAAAFIG